MYLIDSSLSWNVCAVFSFVNGISSIFVFVYYWFREIYRLEFFSQAIETNLV